MQFTINLRKHQVVTDSHFDLPTAGLKNITCGERRLEPGRDYFVLENRLTIKSNFLLSLPSYPLGEVAIIKCNFDIGGPWDIRVFQLDAEVERIAEEKAEARKAVKRKAIGIAIGSAGVMAAFAAAKFFVWRRRK